MDCSAWQNMWSAGGEQGVEPVGGPRADVAGGRGVRLCLVCNPYHRGGITSWMVDLGVAWRRSGGTCWFVVPRPRAPFVTGVGRPTVLEMLESHAANDRPEIIAPVVGSGYEFGTEAHRAAVYARAVAREVPAGVATVVSDDPAAWRAGASLAGRHPFVPVMHSDDQHFYALVRRYGRAATAVVGVSTRVARRTGPLVQVYGIPIATIPCGTRLPHGEAPLRVGNGTLRLIWIGRMVEGQKRVSDLPLIVARVRALGLDCVLDVVGDGPARAPMEAALVRAGLADWVRFHGWVASAEVWRRLAESDVLLLPSNFEGMPVAVMEALAAGCAVVATRISGVEDYEHHALAEGCYWVYAVGDVEGAAHAVVAAARIPRSERGRRARALAEAEFTIERCVERYSRLLDELRAPLGTGSGWTELRRHLVAAMSVPVAAQRMARLWVRGRTPRVQV